VLQTALRVDGAQKPVALGKVSQPGGLFRQVVRELASAHGEVRTIVLISKKKIVEALQLGARGILLKDAAIQLVTKCIEKVLAGEYWVGREVVTSLVDYLRGLKRTEATAEQRLLNLTPREQEIIAAILTGCTEQGHCRKTLYK
jgi:two-component system nitrate/nitrite response regulator NarL